MELMHFGSLHSILHNKSMPLDGSIILPILRDIAQGMRFVYKAENAPTCSCLFVSLDSFTQAIRR